MYKGLRSPIASAKARTAPRSTQLISTVDCFPTNGCHIRSPLLKVGPVVCLPHGTLVDKDKHRRLHVLHPPGPGAALAHPAARCAALLYPSPRSHSALYARPRLCTCAASGTMPSSRMIRRAVSPTMAVKVG